MISVVKDKVLTAAAFDLGRPFQGSSEVGSDHGVDQPAPGAPARGYGLNGRVAALRARQPLARDGIWRVSLDGECAGRLVRWSEEGFWQLLQVDDLTDAQMEAYDTAMQCHPRSPAGDTTLSLFPRIR